jgi:16S rRNA (adenine1518-N6/adenine1519-N6)-dimethyltransferase
MTSRAYVESMMIKLGIEAKKSLGQNFLVSDSAIEKIHRAVQRLQPHTLIEIGPGLGSLTRGFSVARENILLLELDAAFSEYWRSEKYDVIEGDALHWHWDLSARQGPVVLVSNLPYQISKSIVVDRCLDSVPLAGMVLMFQKEVAQKLKAGVKDQAYGMMSVLAQTFWDIETVLEASSGDFLPAPKVASRVLKFTSKPSGVLNPKDFLKFLKACFLHPRKLMISNLLSLGVFNRPALAEIFEAHKLSEKVRAEELTLIQFMGLYRALGYK